MASAFVLVWPYCTARASLNVNVFRLFLLFNQVLDTRASGAGKDADIQFWRQAKATIQGFRTLCGCFSPILHWNNMVKCVMSRIVMAVSQHFPPLAPSVPPCPVGLVVIPPQASVRCDRVLLCTRSDIICLIIEFSVQNLQ